MVCAMTERESTEIPEPEYIWDALPAVQEFISARLVAPSSRRTASADLYREYLAWAASQTMTIPGKGDQPGRTVPRIADVTHAAFGRALTSLGVPRRRASGGNVYFAEITEEN